MNMKVNKDALDWYKEELELETGDQVRFFVRYGGCECPERLFSRCIKRPAGERRHQYGS